MMLVIPATPGAAGTAPGSRAILADRTVQNNTGKNADGALNEPQKKWIIDDKHSNYSAAAAEEASDFLFYAGLPLCDFSKENAVLPNTSVGHDLASRLLASVHLSNSEEAVLDSEKVLSLVTDELKRHCIVRKRFAKRMGIKPSTFSMYMCDTNRTWDKCGQAQKRFLVNLFLWLNLDVRDRLGVFYEAAAGLQEASHVESLIDTVPKISLLVTAVRKEMAENGLKAADLSGSVVRGEPLRVVENLVRSPLCWHLMPSWMKKCYGDLWHWLRQPRTDRMAVIESGRKRAYVTHGRRPVPDVDALCKQAISMAADTGDGLRMLSEKVVRLTVADTQQLLYKPPAWSIASSDIRAAYVQLMKWVSYERDRERRAVEQSMRTEEEWVDEVAKAVPADVIRVPVGTAAADSADGNSVATESAPTPIISNQSSTQSPSAVTTTKGDEGVRFADLDEITLDANVVSKLFREENERIGGGKAISALAEALQINRNYLGSITRHVIPWEKATRVQRTVYRTAWEWLKIPTEKRPDYLRQLKASNGGVPTRLAGERYPRRPRQVRARFTGSQMDYLKRMFEINPKPNTHAKREMAVHLGLSLRTVMVFFSNRRRRDKQEKQQAEAATATAAAEDVDMATEEKKLVSELSEASATLAPVEPMMVVENHTKNQVPKTPDQTIGLATIML